MFAVSINVYCSMYVGGYMLIDVRSKGVSVGRFCAGKVCFVVTWIDSANALD